MMAREVRAPVDLVFGTAVDQPPVSYDSYSADVDNRFKEAFALVRDHLGIAAERMKRQYDIRVRPHKFRKGRWVLYYNPRRFQGKQQKWVTKYSHYLVIEELPPVNYLIQKSKHSRPIISYINKLKTWETDNPSKSWVTDDFDRQTDDADVAGDRDPDNGDVGINDPGPGGDGDVTTVKHQPTLSARLSDMAYVVQNDAYHDDIRDGSQNDATKDLYTISGYPCSSTRRPPRPRRRLRRPSCYKDFFCVITLTLSEL